VEVLNEDGDVEKVTVKFSDDSLISKEVKNIEFEINDFRQELVLDFSDGSSLKVALSKGQLHCSSRG
jgi:hypothetical protein